MEEPTTMRVSQRLDAADADEALISFGIATAIRDAAITIGIGLGLLYLYPVPWAGLGLLAAWAAAALLVVGLLAARPALAASRAKKFAAAANLFPGVCNREGDGRRRADHAPGGR